MSKRSNPLRIRIATFNIRHGLGLDGRVDLERTAASVLATGADLIALQELDVGLARSGEVDQPAEIARLTGLEMHFRATLHLEPGAYGIAVAARLPLEAGFEPLPRAGSEEPRGAIVVRLEGLTVIATHLSTDRRARRRQVRALAALATARPGPVVVTGDLNSSRWGLGPLARAGFRGERLGPTVVKNPFPRQIDHVLGGPGVAVSGTRALPGGASDHVPVAATVEMP